MQVKTVRSYRAGGLKFQTWKVMDDFFLAEIYGDGVCHLFHCDANGLKRGENLVGHNTHGVGDAKRVAREIVSRRAVR